MATAPARLQRYSDFIEDEFAAGLLKPTEYSLDDMDVRLVQRIAAGEFKRIVFTGMGCSAIVSDVLRGFLIERGVAVDVFVLNDYDPTFLLPAGMLGDETTLVVVSSYSGHSTEPLMALERMSAFAHRIILLTSGGPLAERGRQLGVSRVYWRLSNPDREYPLFHVTQYFAILLDVFSRFGLLPHNYQDNLAVLAKDLNATSAAREEQARQLAADSTDANVVLIASPKWHETLLKLCKMHLNEIAMMPATRNYLHEFCHSEIASLSDPGRRHSVLVFLDRDDDEYTRAKADNLIGLLTAARPENAAVAVARIELDQPDFLLRLFSALDLVQRTTRILGTGLATPSRELISEAAGNRWYHSSTINAERLAAVA